MKRRHIITAVIAAVVAIGAGSSPATAAEGPATAELVQQLEARLDALGVAPEAQPGLVEKVLSGELPDSDIGAAPTSTSTTISGAYAVTRSTY